MIENANFQSQLIQRENKNISNKAEQKVLIDLKQYNLSLKYIAEVNNISDNRRNIKGTYERLSKACNQPSKSYIV